MNAGQAQRPTSNDSERWKAHWIAQGMPWRTEPEITEERQHFLIERRAVQADIEKGIYPFLDENGPIKLKREDVEWLLATHESQGKPGPVIWSHEKDQPAAERRFGLDLRGADLRKADLHELPLARLVAGLDLSTWQTAT